VQQLPARGELVREVPRASRVAGSFAQQNKAATYRAAPTAGVDGDLDPALLPTICWR
jgi:hypothetical protein